MNQKLALLSGKIIAHRGFYNNQDIPENSIKAFSKAMEYQYPIELDVHITKDFQIVVFHDDNLKRMTGKDINIIDVTYQEIQDITLLDTEEKIPLLKDVLRLVDGKVLLDIEVKMDGTGIIEPYLAQILDTYHGDFLIKSFQPKILYWFRRHRKQYTIGLLFHHFRKPRLLWLKERIGLFLLRYVIKIDFIAPHISQLENPMVQECHVPIFVWTIRDEKELAGVRGKCDTYIVEKILKEQR